MIPARFRPRGSGSRRRVPRGQPLRPIDDRPISKANEALDHLRRGKARYRVVLDASK
jgi:hypothetical protein